MADMVTFRVPDMSCAHCEKAVRSALGAAFPGAPVEVDLDGHIVRVAGEAGRARAALVDAGYTPEPA